MIIKLDENKYRNWIFTWNGTIDNHFTFTSAALESFLKEESDSYSYQLEQGHTTLRTHYQGCFRTKIRLRHSTLLKKFSDRFEDIQHLTLSRMCGTWEENVHYTTKSDTAIPDTIVQSKDLQRYLGTEIGFLSDKDFRYPWQKDILDQVFYADEITLKTPDDRSIIWITDTKGNSGKSKLIKYLCFNYSDIVKISFGTASQLRSSIISAGPKKMYIVDMPRTLGDDDSIPSLLSSIEDIKNGFVVSSMYGKHQSLMMDPPHILVFSNIECPVSMMSDDRWKIYSITPYKTLRNHFCDITGL